MESWKIYFEKSTACLPLLFPSQTNQGRDSDNTLLYQQYWDIPTECASDKMH